MKVLKTLLLNIPGIIVSVVLAFVTTKFIDIELWILVIAYILLYILVVLIGWLGNRIFGSALVMNPEDKGIKPNEEAATRAIASRRPEFITDAKEIGVKRTKKNEPAKVVEIKQKEKTKEELFNPDEYEALNIEEQDLEKEEG